MLNPKYLNNGVEQYEPYTSAITKKALVQYDYRHTDGNLFSCVRPTLEKCREARDKWIQEEKNMTKKQHEIIATINEINFYKGNVIDNGKELQLLVFTDDENYRIDIDEDIQKACMRIYNNYYADNESVLKAINSKGTASEKSVGAKPLDKEVER